MFFESKNLIKRAMRSMVLLFALPCITFALGEISYSFPENTLSITEIEAEGQTYNYIRLSGCPSYTDEIGAPYLPCKEVSFVLPYNQYLEEVEIVSIDSASQDCDYSIYPTQPPRRTDGSPPPPFVPPDLFYYSDIYPGKIVKILSDGYRSGFRIATIRLYPIQYFDQKLTLYTNITISLSLGQANELGPYAFRRSRMGQELVERTIRSLVENPDEVEASGPPTQIVDVPCQPFYITPGPSLDGSVVDYVIITDDTLKSEFERLVDWRLKQGIVSTITTTVEIAGSYSGRDPQEKIRNYIKDAYSNWGTIFVLLAGDIQYVPHRICGGGYATDLYYSDLEGNWDDNENSIFGEYPSSTHLSSVHFYSQTKGWLISQQGQYNLPSVYRTTDGGLNWLLACTSDCQLNYVYFRNDTLGWVVGNRGLILKTVDGGLSWTEQPRDSQLLLNAASFPNDMVGYAVGDSISQSSNSVGVILKTTDGGDNWYIISYLDSAIHLSDVAFVDDSTGWVVGSARKSQAGNPRGIILNTTDGGVSWSIQQISSDSFDYTGVTFPSINEGWVISIEGKILHTSDGGYNWIDQISHIQNDLYDISFDDSNIGWAIGYDGVIIKTEDGGELWFCQTSNTNNVLFSCSFVDANYGWIVGGSGIILQTTDGGDNWIKDSLLFGDLSVLEYSPDIWVGRIPSGNILQAQIFIDKVFTYEISPPNDYLQKLLFMAAVLESTYGPYPDIEPPDQKEDFQDCSWFQGSSLQNYDVYELYNPISYGNRWSGDEELNRINAIQQFNEGYHFINHMDHSDYYCLGTSWELLWQNINNSDADSLMNLQMISILWTYGCKAGAFDFDAICEHLINNPKGGCIAFIGNSDDGFASQYIQDTCFFKALFWDTLEHIGQAFAKTQGSPISYGFSTIMNLLGDPTMPVWTDTASTLVAEHPAFIPIEPYMFNVKVYTGNGITPLPGALVTLLEHANEIYQIDTTDENGQVSFYIDPKYSAEMAVTVTKRLFKPYCGTCNIGLSSNMSNATGYNQGQRLVRAPNTDWLYLTYQSDAQSLHSMSVNSGQNWSKPSTIDYGRYPAVTLSSNGFYPWVFYFDRGAFCCAVQRSDGTWNIRTIFESELPEESGSIGPAITLATPSPVQDGDLAYGVFSILDSIYIVAFDTIETYYIEALENVGQEEFLYAPSISITPMDLIHVVWQKTDSSSSRIYYKTTLDPITSAEIRGSVRPNWSDEFRVSFAQGYTTEPALNPSVEASGEYVYAAWRGPNQYGQFPGDIWRRERRLSDPYNRWFDPRNMSQTPTKESNYPVMSTGRVTAWQEELPDTNWDVYCRIGDDTINLSDSKEPSCFPHINYQCIWVPGNPPDLGYFIENIHSVYTERIQSNLYEVKFKKYLYSIQSQPPDEYLKVETGNETASVYCEDRDGFVQWDNYAIDYESDSLKYTIPYLHPRKFYLIKARVIHDSIGDWQEKFLAENGVGRTVRFSNSGLETLYFLIRPEDYQDDKKFDLVIDKLLGSYSALEELSVSEVEIDTQRYGGGIQSWYDEDLIVGKLTKLYHIAPNPFRRSGLIRYQLAQKSRVNLQIYDILGRSVRTLENGMKDPGKYEVRWDGKDNRSRTLSHGIYFIRLKTDDNTEVKKAVLVK
jgi:photosystem II stability/assembly factor-like uncharacterized protein